MKTGNRFKKITDVNGETYLCDIEFVRRNSETDPADTDACLEADVAGRYAGNIEVVQ